jgi:ankyrin repeat protein
VVDDGALLSLMTDIVHGARPAVLASLQGCPELATARLERGATRQRSTEFFLPSIGHHVYAGDTALHLAAAAYQVAIVSDLVAAGADVDAANRRGARPLHYAVDGVPGSDRWNPVAQRDTVGRLLRLGADPDAVDANGTTPLLRAVRNRCASAVEALLAGGADPDIRNRRGSSALHLATTSTGRGGSGSAEAKAEQDRIVRLLAAGTTN